MNHSGTLPASDSAGQTKVGRERQTEVVFMAPGDVGKGRVEPISWMQTCGAYAEQGLDVTLVSLRVRRPDALPIAEVWRHYGLDRQFRIISVPTLLGRDAPTWWFRLWAGFAAFAFAVRTEVSQLLDPRTVIVHARLPILIAPFLVLRGLLPRGRRPRIVLETHAMPRRSHGWVLRSADLVVTNSSRLAHDLAVAFGIPSAQVVHVPLGPYNRVRRYDKFEARAKLGLAADTVMGAYVGKLNPEICEFLFGTASILRDRMDEFRLLVVGGNPTILAWARKRLKELGLEGVVILTGFIEPSDVDLYQGAADVLLFYVPDSFQTFPYCTPSKGYEYQAAGQPIVAADIPLFEEVFGQDGERAIRVAEHSPHAMAAGVLQALALDDGGRAMTNRAAAWVRERTWERRAEMILGALGL
jgi:glycosyltransferase involved in cell wall biosynthesis